MTSTRALGVDTTAEEAAGDVDLSGRVAVVTGASGGLGAETARVLAARGATVVVTARDVAKAEGVAGQIAAASGRPVEVLPLELGSFDSIRTCAAEIGRRHPAIHILVNNAGVMACPLGHTEAGHELQFGTNHLGHFAFTHRLLPALVAGAPTRIVCVSSAGHRFSPVVFDDIHFERRAYDKWLAYGQAKTANALHAVELDRRYRDRGVRAFSVHPGAIVTELGRHLTPDDFQLLTSRAPGGRLSFKTVECGAATQVWAATSPDLDGQGGVYCEDCHVATVKDAPDDAPNGVARYAVDPAAAARLWDLSLQACGLPAA